MTASGAWAEVLEEFAQHLREDTRIYLSGKPAGPRTSKTRESYLDHLRWLSEGADVGPWEITSQGLARWLDSHNWSLSTRKKVLVSLRTFYAWGVAQGRLEWAPTAGLPSSEHLTRGPAARPWPDAWAPPVNGFVEALRGAGRSEGTVGQYLRRVRQLSELAADPWAVTEQQLSQWLSNPDWAPQTKRSSRAAAVVFYRWAKRAGYIEVSPAEELPIVRVPRAVPRPATHDVVREALAAADDRTRLAILLAVDAGLRRSEIAGLHTRQVTPTHHLLVIGKGGHERIVPMDPDGELAAALRVEIERRRRGQHGSGWSGKFVTATGYLFPSDLHPGPMTAGHLGKLISRALPEGTAHMLRHRFATDAYLVERDLQAVQQLLGHAKPETTAVYAQVPDGAMLTAVKGAGARRRLA